MDESTLLLLLYVGAMPLLGLAIYFFVRWVIRRFPGKTRRDLEDVKLRLATIEEVVTHLSRRKTPSETDSSVDGVIEGGP